MKSNIPQIVDALCKKYDSRDPYEISRQLGIVVEREELGSVRGYYNCEYGLKMIHINSELDTGDQRMVCAHELGHAVLHPGDNTPFLRAYTFYSVDKMETEANRFMAYLEITDDELLEYREHPMTLLADIYGVSVELIRWRYEQLKF